MDSYSDIGSLQIRVLRILWERGDGTVHEVLEAFPPGDRPAYTTVLNVLRTLERRGSRGGPLAAVPGLRRLRPPPGGTAAGGGAARSE
jgi:hypothetical protein